MKYRLSTGVVIDIPNQELKQLQTMLSISEYEALKVWLADNDYIVNEEQEKLDKKAKSVKVSREIVREKVVSKKPKKPKVSNEKKELFDALGAFLGEYCSEKGGKCQVLTENKLFSVQIGDKKLKLDLIQSRKQPKSQKMCSFTKILHIFCAFFYYFMLDKQKILCYNGGPRTVAAACFSCQWASCINFDLDFCVFFYIDFSQNKEYN